MAWSPVTWAYKDLITSAKLAQMQENIRAHDHRADGTQGDPASIISGPTFGAGAASIATGVLTTLATIVLPAVNRKSTLWLLFAAITTVAYHRVDCSLQGSIDSRLVIPTFVATGSASVSSFNGGAAGGGCQWALPVPMNAGAATGSSMLARMQPIGGNVTEARVLWWVDS